MNSALKYIAIIVVALVTFMILSQMKHCWQSAPDTVTLVMPSDSNFAMIVKKEYRPVSTPFEKRSKPPAKLPSGVKERDVKRVVVVVDVYPDSINSVSLVELKSGEVFVPKEEGRTVEEYTYKSPILDFDLFPLVGLTFGGKLSPAVALSPLQVYESVQLPLIVASPDGVGMGFAGRYREYSLGLTFEWRYRDAGKQAKLVVAYNFN